MEFQVGSDLMSMPTSTLVPNGFKEKQLLIWVIDDNRKMQKDYWCNLKLIMKHMKYLESKIDPMTKNENEL